MIIPTFNLHHRLLLLLPLCLFALLACQQRKTYVLISDSEQFRDGDLVLRCGWGVESRAVTQSSRSPFSHIGILIYDSATTQWNVIHAVPGEAPKGQPEYIKVEPITEFFSPTKAQKGAWLRINCTCEVAHAAALYALSKANSIYIFDNNYLLGDTTQLYCTELVWQAYLHQGIDISSSCRHDVPTIFSKEGECIFPVDIQNSPTTLFVKHFDNK